MIKKKDVSWNRPAFSALATGASLTGAPGPEDVPSPARFPRAELDYDLLKMFQYKPGKVAATSGTPERTPVYLQLLGFDEVRARNRYPGRAEMLESVRDQLDSAILPLVEDKPWLVMPSKARNPLLTDRWTQGHPLSLPALVHALKIPSAWEAVRHLWGQDPAGAFAGERGVVQKAAGHDRLKGWMEQSGLWMHFCTSQMQRNPAWLASRLVTELLLPQRYPFEGGAPLLKGLVLRTWQGAVRGLPLELPQSGPSESLGLRSFYVRMFYDAQHNCVVALSNVPLRGSLLEQGHELGIHDLFGGRTWTLRQLSREFSLGTQLVPLFSGPSSRRNQAVQNRPRFMSISWGDRVPIS